MQSDTIQTKSEVRNTHEEPESQSNLGSTSKGSGALFLFKLSKSFQRRAGSPKALAGQSFIFRFIPSVAHSDFITSRLNTFMGEMSSCLFIIYVYFVDLELVKWFSSKGHVEHGHSGSSSELFLVGTEFSAIPNRTHPVVRSSNASARRPT